MENPGASVTPRGMARHVACGSSQIGRPTSPQRRRTQRGELLEWADRLGSAGDLVAVGLSRRLRPTGQRLPPPSRQGSRVGKRDAPKLQRSASGSHRVGRRSPHRPLPGARSSTSSHASTNSTANANWPLGALDFNDLERRAVDLLRRNEDVQTRVRAQFRQVMLDEFQDINQQQSELIELVRGEDVFFAVGDVNQSIYGFRHARPEIFHEYRSQYRQFRQTLRPAYCITSAAGPKFCAASNRF